MIVVIQRIIHTSMALNSQGIACIGLWLLVLVGIVKGGMKSDVPLMVEKIPPLRILVDTQVNMNQLLFDGQGELLLASQFIVLAKTTKRPRHCFGNADPPEEARSLYQLLLEKFGALDLAVPGGNFGAVSLDNDGPVSFSLEKPG